MLDKLLNIGGLLIFTVGCLDPLCGWPLIVFGTVVILMSAILANSRYRRLLYKAIILQVIGIIAMLVISAYGGIANWWLGLLIIPYLVGGFLALLGALLRLNELCQV